MTYFVHEFYVFLRVHRVNKQLKLHDNNFEYDNNNLQYIIK